MAKKKSHPKRQYSEDDKANALAALAANGGNMQRTARELNIPEATLRKWAKGHVHPQVVQKCDQKKGPLADSLENVSWALLEGVTPAKIAETNVKELLTAVGIAIDKMQLLRGKPTAIGKHDFGNMNDDELDKAIESEQRALAGNAAGEAPPTGEGPDSADGGGGGSQSA